MTESGGALNQRSAGHRLDLLDVVKASLVFVGICAAACLLWIVRDGLLVIFAAAIAAILLKVFANAIASWTRLPGIMSLVVATLLILLVVFLAGWLFGTHIAAEFSEVSKRATSAWNKINEQLQNTKFAGLEQKIEQNTTPEIGSSVRERFSMLTTAIEALVVLIVSALNLAAEPRLYRTGVIKLFKPELQVWAGERIDVFAQAMKLWLYGQLVTMLLVGVLSGVAMWIIGVPGPLALALISFITEAIPYLGPFLGAIPAVLVATTKSLDAPLYAAGAYLLIHVVEGYLISPMIQRYFVSIPPALMLLGITISELLFGTPGLLIAAPLTVAVFMIVRMFYLREALHERTALPEPDGFGREEGALARAETRSPS